MTPATIRRSAGPLLTALLAVALLPAVAPAAPLAADGPRANAPAPEKPHHRGGGEASLVLPDLNDPNVRFLGGLGGKDLLYSGLAVSVAGLVFGLVAYTQLKNMPVHRSMLEVSELIYETCKTYLLTQGKFLVVLWVFIGVIIAVYFGFLTEYTDPATKQTRTGFPPDKIAIILLFSVIGILGSYGVAWFGIRVNTFANSRTAFASLTGKAYPCYAIPLKAGISIGMLLISVELLLMLVILMFIPGDLAGACFIGFAVGESLGAAALRVAGGIFTKIADIGADLMKIVFRIKEDDARNPGVIADCTGDNAGDSVGPSADGFETYGVTGVALITFILLAVTPTAFPPAGEGREAVVFAEQVVAVATDPTVRPAYMTAIPTAAPADRERMQKALAAANDQGQYEAAWRVYANAHNAADAVRVQLLVWIFMMRVMMVIASAASYFINEARAKAKYSEAANFNYEEPLTFLVWLTSLVSVALTYLVSFLLIRDLGDGSLWWKLSTIITCGTLAGAIIPELVKVFTSTESGHVKEVVTSSRQGGASLNILSGFVAGNFSAYWLGIVIAVLMGMAYGVSTLGLGDLMYAPAVFAFGLVAFGFLGMGPVTIAVDSYGPVTDNAQSVYELSTIEEQPDVANEIQSSFGFAPNFAVAKDNLEKNDGAGNTFKATAKPVLIGTAVVGATTMIFSINVGLTTNDAGVPLTKDVEKLSLLYAPFLLGLIAGGAVVYWFTGASTQAVTTGAYRAVEFIKANIRLDDTVKKASTEDSKKVVGICTQYAQQGMFNIFLTVFFATLGFAFLEPYFFIGYLVSIALFGLYQAIFMANAGGAWDNAKKIVETELKAKGTDLHAATVVGDTVGDPFKDTSSVALNPIIKFTTLFGLLAVELAVSLTAQKGAGLSLGLAAVFLAVSMFFVYRSFYGMRIKDGGGHVQANPVEGVTGVHNPH
jgi:K(+)-stimulated pyrophosphate-energized sodium pump